MSQLKGNRTGRPAVNHVSCMFSERRHMFFAVEPWIRAASGPSCAEHMFAKKFFLVDWLGAPCGRAGAEHYVFTMLVNCRSNHVMWTASGRACVENYFANLCVGYWWTDCGGQRSSNCRALFRKNVGRQLVDRFGRPAVDQLSSTISQKCWSTVGRPFGAASGRPVVEHYFAKMLVDNWSTD